MWVADTSWLYALVDGEDAHHAKARKEAEEPSPLVVNPATLVEFLDLVRDKRGHAASQAALEGLIRFPSIRFSGPAKPAAMARVVSSHVTLTWQDAAAICTALDEGAGLRTFDKDQKKAFAALT